jgi:hypothetical protein
MGTVTDLVVRDSSHQIRCDEDRPANDRNDDPVLLCFHLDSASCAAVQLALDASRQKNPGVGEEKTE